MLKQILIIILLLTVAHKKVCAQPQSDFLVSGSVDIEKKISRSFSAAFYNQNVWAQNATEHAYSLFDFGLEYRVIQQFSIGASYRIVDYRLLSNGYQKRNMFIGDLVYSDNYKKLNVSLRCRFQSLYYGEINDENYKPNAYYNRNRLQLRYKLNYYWSPYASMELFYPLNNPKRTGADAFRETAGVLFTINKRIKLDAYYQLTQTTQRINKRKNYMLNLTLLYKL